MNDELEAYDNEIKIHTDLIVLWMMKYGELDKITALKIFYDANLHLTKTGKYNKTFLHEDPYYWAMSLLKGFDNSEWYQDKELWPPPKAYKEVEEAYYQGKLLL